MIQKKSLYFFVTAGALAGVAWVIWNRNHYIPADPHTGLNACLFKAATGLPCPSCGSTRSVLAITQFHFGDAVYANPFGYLIALAIILIPIWVSYDVITRKQTFTIFTMPVN